MSHQQPITLIVLDDFIGDIIAESTDFDGYVPRLNEHVLINKCAYKIIEADWNWCDELNQFNSVTLIARKLK